MVTWRINEESFANPSLRLLADGGFIHFSVPKETRAKKGGCREGLGIMGEQEA
jgi:hypothetical protein